MSTSERYVRLPVVVHPHTPTPSIGAASVLVCADCGVMVGNTILHDHHCPARTNTPIGQTYDVSPGAFIEGWTDSKEEPS